MSEEDPIHRAERAMLELLRQHLGSPSEQYERIEALIDSFDRAPTGIDRTASPYWRTSALLGSDDEG
jgi:hypothetical protein